MEYLFLVKMKVKGYSYFIELAKTYELLVHPNIGDLIIVDECFCKIKEIVYWVTADTKDQHVYLKLNMYDPQHVVTNAEQAREVLISDIKEYEEYDWYLNDYDLGDYKYNSKDV